MVQISSFLFALLLFMPAICCALEPAEVGVIYNRFDSQSADLAEYYMEKRGIPKHNLIKIDTTNKETCSRREYDEEIAAPIRKFLNKKREGPAIRCLVTMYGVPLKVRSPELSSEEKKRLEVLVTEKKALRKELKSAKSSKDKDTQLLENNISKLDKQIKSLKKRDYSAAVDSELTLVMKDSYPLKFWQPNPFFIGFRNQKLSISKSEAIMVSRLDGPSVKIVKRIIDDAVTVEKVGLQGTAYFDAKSPKPNKTPKGGSGFYDNSIQLAAEYLSSQQLLPVVLNEVKELFQPGEAPDAALYCGWYSLARYVDAFDWNPGSVGYHIASQECQSLKGSGGYWCRSMLEDGITATLGPVGEPYLQAFPIPEMFFKLLTDGYYTLAEAYFLSLPYVSWKMVLVGDPLYRPFKVRR